MARQRYPRRPGTAVDRTETLAYRGVPLKERAYTLAPLRERRLTRRVRLKNLLRPGVIARSGCSGCPTGEEISASWAQRVAGSWSQRPQLKTQDRRRGQTAPSPCRTHSGRTFAADLILRTVFSII